MWIHVLFSVVGAVWAGRVAARKGHTSMLFALGGLLFPVIGVAFAYYAYPAPEKLSPASPS